MECTEKCDCRNLIVRGINFRSWKEKLQEAEERKKSEINYLRHCGIAIELDYKEIKSTPCLVNLAADPMLSGTLLYLIPSGKVRIGRQGKQIDSMDIVLDGPLVAPFHWLVMKDEERHLPLHAHKHFFFHFCLFTRLFF